MSSFERKSLNSRPGLIRWLPASVLLCIVSALPSAAQTLHITTTSADLKQALSAQPAVTFSTAAPKVNTPRIEVDPAQHFQSIDGFGASLTDSAAWLLETKLDTATRRKAMLALFDANEGIGLTILRQPMGGTDLARTHYSYDDMPRGQKDPALAHFSIARDEEVILPALREALAVQPAMKIIATPWSVPAWMKTSGSLIGGKLRKESYPAFAQYFVKYVQSYQAAGIPIWAVTLQNEPLYEPKDYMGMKMSAKEQRDVLRDHFGPAFAKAGLSTKIMVYDHNWDHPEYAATILSDPAAARYAAGTAYHCYGGQVEAQSATHAQFPDKDIWETECSGGTWQKDKAFQSTAELVIGTTRNWARSVVLWGLALDPDGNPHAGGCGTCRGVITVDDKTQPASFHPTLDYYVLGQASKFVRTGARRIASSEAAGVMNVAFENPDGSLALLVLNAGNAPVEFTVAAQGRTAQVTLSGNTLATLDWQPEAATSIK